MPRLRSSRGLRLLAACTLFVCADRANAAEPRVETDLLVLYRFDTVGGDVIRDRSGVGEALDLRIEGPAAVQSGGGPLTVTSPAKISSAGPARKVAAAVRQSGELTIEAWIRPQNAQQAGPARIVSLSANPGERNFTLAQDAARYDVRLRTTGTNTNGLPSTATPDNSVAAGELTHVVYTRAGSGDVVIYVNGKQSVANRVEGDLSNWGNEYRLLLANELTGDRPWLGELHLVALYRRALTAAEVTRNFDAGVPAGIDYAALMPPAVERPVDFVKDVQPILRERCFECHAQGNEEGGLNLGVRDRVMEGGKTGPVLVRGKSVASRMIHLVAGVEEDAVMPPPNEGERLTREEIGVLRAWIDRGANWPFGADVLDPRAEQARSHWAFQPLKAVEPPAVQNESWVQTPIDRFILAALEAKGLSPATPAPPRQLMRRLSFDVAGLPPSPAELDQFVADAERDRRAAVEALADRLLESRHYGERWGRHWLDVARYTDSDGYESDRDRPNAYHYRDFVIRALNDDLPYDTFVRWQLAGDEYAPQDPAAVAATGFLTGAPNSVLDANHLEEERLRNRYDELDDMLSTTGTALLGLTLGCARCHDHKYDAISSREYYRLLSALHSGERAELPIGTGGQALAFRDRGAVPQPTWLFERGDFYDRDQPVQLGFLQVLLRGRGSEDYWAVARGEPPRPDSTYQRKALAEWITDLDHGAGPLLARVIVNRVWQHHFGEGLVRTVSDFGVRGEAPTHPELLEWLTQDFVQNGWKLKRLHRTIIASAVYQQGTEFDPGKAQVDPENRLLWRMRPRRLEAEILRDAMLSVSGTLNLDPHGPGFKPPIAAEAVVARNVQTPYPKDAQDTPATRRRSVYMFHKRVVPYPLFVAFDRPDLLKTCGRRDTTTIAPQALALLNDGFVRSRSLDFADRLLQQAGDDRAGLVSNAFGLALGRGPGDSEREASIAFIQSQIERRQQRESQAAAGDVRRQAVADFCQTLFSLNEFLYVD